MSDITKRAVNAKRSRRTTRFRLPLSARSDIDISLRRFRTQKAHRSQRTRQLVFTLRGLPIKEICLSRHQHRRPHYTTVGGFRIGSAALIILGLSGAGVSGQQVFVQQDLHPAASHIATSPKKLQSFADAAPMPLSRSEPNQLRINKIDLTAPVVPTGLTADGALAVPGPHDVGWYNQGPTPGEKGPAVFVGHVDYINDVAVFWRLRELEPNDTFDVTRADGSTVTFRVDSVQQYSDENFPTQAVYGALSYAGIRLITCGGTFNHMTHHYSDNMVVFGTMLSAN